MDEFNILQVWEAISQYIKTTANYVVSEINSPFVIATTGSFFGAVGGYVMVLLTNRRAEIRSKVTAINAAITTAHMLFNTFLGLKKQHLKSLCERYKEDKTKFAEVTSAQSESPREIETLQFPPINSDLINSKLFDKTDLLGRSLSLAMVFHHSSWFFCLYALLGLVGRTSRI